MCERLGAPTTTSVAVLSQDACPWAALTHNHKSLFNVAWDFNAAAGVSGPEEQQHTNPQY